MMTSCTVLLSALLFIGIRFWMPNTTTDEPIEQTSEIETEAFMASLQREKSIWVITLNPQYYAPAKAVSITYNDTLYGLFLITDMIYLPAYASSVDLQISPLDVNGNPLKSESFILGDDVHEDSRILKAP